MNAYQDTFFYDNCVFTIGTIYEIMHDIMCNKLLQYGNEYDELVTSCSLCYRLLLSDLRSVIVIFNIPGALILLAICPQANSGLE